MELNCIYWPAQSLDLNLINKIRASAQRHRMYFLEEMKKVIKEEWNQLIEEDFCKCIENTHYYCKLLILARGGSIKY